MANDKVEQVFQKLAASGVGRFVDSSKNYVGKAEDAAQSFLKSDFAKQLGMFGTGMVISQFVEEVIKYLRKKSVEAKSPKYYKKMLSENPELQKESPKEVASLWETMYRTAPTLAKDPVAAGAFIRQSINKEVMQEHGGPPIDTYKTLVDIESGRSKDDSGVGSKLMDMFTNS